MTTKKRVLILSFSPIAADARVLKQVVLLRERFELYTCGYGPAPDGVERHFEVPEDLAVWRYDRALLLLRQYKRAYWSNEAVVSARRLLEEKEFEVVLANDVDSVGLALSLRPGHGVHADLHEYAPRQKEDSARWRIFVAPFIRWMCRAFVSRAASVTTVGRGIADEYERVFGIRAEVVTNAAPYSDVPPRPVTKPIRLVHSGACLRDRNIVSIIDAVEAAKPGTTLDLYLTPNDPGHLAELKRRAAGSDRITVHAPVAYSSLNATLNAFDVGVHVLPPVNFNNSWALPNKFFDYVQARLGVIIGPSHEMARLVGEFHFGAVTSDFSVAALTTAIDNLTVAEVAAWKRASDAAAKDLSAETQLAVWDRAIQRLVTGSEPSGATN